MSDGQTPEHKPSALVELIRSVPNVLTGLAAGLAALTGLLTLLLK